MLELRANPAYSHQLTDVTALRERFGARWLQVLLAAIENVVDIATGALHPRTGTANPDTIDDALNAYQRSYPGACTAVLDCDVFHYHQLNFFLKVVKRDGRVLVDFGDVDSRTWPNAGQTIVEHLLNTNSENPWDTSRIAMQLRQQHTSIPAIVTAKSAALVGTAGIGFGTFVELTSNAVSELFMPLAEFFGVMAF